MSDEEKRCIRCGHLVRKDAFCIQCGAPTINRCSYDGGPFGDPCSKVNEPDAVFCANCGCYTHFYLAGLLYTPYEQNTEWKKDDYDEFRHFYHPFFTD